MARLRPRSWRFVVVVATAVLLPVLALVAPGPGHAAAGAVTSAAQPQLLAKAQPDECFNGIGNPYPPGPPCAAGQPKVNQAYVWGLTKTGNTLWFGTGANVNCVVSGYNIHNLKPQLTDDWVCEFGKSQSSIVDGVPAALGDLRPPEVFTYDVAAGTLTDRTQEIRDASDRDSNLLDNTVGMRSAGSLNGVAFLGGPGVNGGINLFAFDTDTGAYLGSHTFAQYSNIRHFVAVDGVLYAGVALSADSNQNPTDTAGGRVLRWIGDRSDPFGFEEVGDLPDQVAELTAYDNHLAINTWPSTVDGDAAGAVDYAGLWLSPAIPDGGLTPADANGWTELWRADQYEPDPTIAGTYGGGSLVEYKGDLYFGTMHVPWSASEAIIAKYPPTSKEQATTDASMSQRSTSIWRIKDTDGANPTIQLLYGASTLPAYDPTANDGAGGWRDAPTGWTPLYGPSGFGNSWNNYTWTMGVSSGKLYIGTMDWSLLENDLLPTEAARLGTSATALARRMTQQGNGYGADLWEFSSGDGPATAVSTDGVGNYLNYGVRTMVASGSTLYLGMADPMNLDTSTTDGKPQGGWELIALDTAS